MMNRRRFMRLSAASMAAVRGSVLESHPLSPELQGWTLVWSDEFDYKGCPDPIKWGYEEGYVRHNELQYYTINRLENARVDGEHLLIELRKETPESFLPTSLNDEWHRYTSASINTRNTAYWTYGRFEIVAKMPQGKVPGRLSGF